MIQELEDLVNVFKNRNKKVSITENHSNLNTDLVQIFIFNTFEDAISRDAEGVIINYIATRIRRKLENHNNIFVGTGFKSIMIEIRG